MQGKWGSSHLFAQVVVLPLGWAGQTQSGQPDRLWLGCYEERVGLRVLTSLVVAHPLHGEGRARVLIPPVLAQQLPRLGGAQGVSPALLQLLCHRG